MPRYYVSGVIQIEVSAPNAREAVLKALKKQDALMRKQYLNVSVENITGASFSSDTVALGDAGEIDQ